MNSMHINQAQSLKDMCVRINRQQRFGIEN